jgi:hypothetical protein
MAQKSIVVAALAYGAVGACSLLSLAAPAQAAPPAPVGCHSAWPVIAHHAGGMRVNPPGPLPTPCASETGYATSETTIAATPTGTLFFSPANTENALVRSSDRGASWSLAAPQQMQYTSLWNTVDPQTIVDRRTGRVFWLRATGDLRTAPILVDESPLGWQAPTAIAYAHGFQVYSTDDNGQTWVTADYQHEFTGDWEKIYVGPPAAGGPQPSGYPDVVYMCANAPFEVSGPGRDCYRSLDGGQTFALVGYVLPSAASPHDVCEPLAGGAGGGVGSDGSLYQPQSCQGGSWVAVSHDEGASWSWFPITGAPGTRALTSGLQLAIDHANNLYALWTDGSQLELSISRDGGKAWGRPLEVAAPGLRQVDLPALAAGPAGHVGVAYYGSTDTSAKTLTAYLTQTSDALDQRPLFYSAALNERAHPIFEDYAGSDTPRADFIGATYDSSGNLWAGLVKQLGPPDASSTVPTTGYVGTLEPAALPAPTDRCGSGKRPGRGSAAKRGVHRSAGCPTRSRHRPARGRSARARRGITG